MTKQNLVNTNDVGEGVRIIALNDPDKRNALSADLVTDVVSALNLANAEDSVRAVVLTGAAGAFCSGGDLAEMAAPNSATELAEGLRSGIQRLPRAVLAFEKPLVAAIDGPAIGAGLDLALLCDVRVASQSAVFSTGFMRIGLVAADGGAWLLPRIIGKSRALELLWTADRFSSSDAHEWGMLRDVVEVDQLIEHAIAIARRFAAMSPIGVRMMKRLVREAESSSAESALELGASLAALASGSDEHQVAMKAALGR